MNNCIRACRSLAAAYVCGAIVLATAEPLAAQNAPDSTSVDAELARKIEILTEEVTTLREQMSVPATDKELRGMYGMGPAASKVYGVSQGVSFGGYGEFYFASPLNNSEATGDVARADFLRLITYIGYKFNSQIVMNAEIEYEHATTGSNWEGNSGEIAIEFAYLDFLIDPAFNIRTGNLLLPVGLINQMHEPTTFPGNFRPITEQRILPTTWRELGIGAHGSAGDFNYSAYAVNGLNAAGFSTTGIRGGRQKGNRAIWEDVGGVIGAEYSRATAAGAIALGASAYAGGADQGLLTDSTGVLFNVSNQVYEGHVAFRRGAFEARALLAASHVTNAEALSRALYSDTSGVLTAQVPETQLGWYVEAGYDVVPLLWQQASFTLKPWVRYEQYNLQKTVASGTTIDPDPSLEGTLLTLGLESKPHPNVVLKLDFAFPTNEAGDRLSDEIRLGAGFIY